ncbi:hypothetical protein ACFORO_02120 [Amycolatopsis halotolerans]|uniref:Serine/threonine protein kinase n=1 Tax=Amycolatopsis halotolerans TaxID=330083 RepID=A0ABV7Q9Z5_9PSEU
MNDDEARAVILLAGPVDEPPPGVDPERLLSEGRKRRQLRNLVVVGGSALTTALLVVLVTVTAGQTGPATAPQTVQPAVAPTTGPQPAPTLVPTPGRSSPGTTPNRTTTTGRHPTSTSHR